MSYGSTFVQFEANGRMSQKFSRPSYRKDETSDRSHKLVQYEKQFDVNLSRVEGQPIDRTSVRNSMLNYSRKMRTLQEARNGKGDSLFVRAKHIPKHPVRAPKKRRPMSFDELLGRDRDVGSERPSAAKTRPHSDKSKSTRNAESKSDNELHLPLLTERLRKSGSNVQVSLVSASDLYDIVDFSLRSKGTRNDSLQMLRLEQEANSHELRRNKNQSEIDSSFEHVFPDNAYNRFERTTDRSSDSQKRLQKLNNVQNFFDSSYADGHIPSEEFYEQIFAMDKSELSPQKSSTYRNSVKLPSIEPFKRRPQRAKRMKLIDPDLDDIPEDNVIETHNSVFNAKREVVRVNSPTPQKSSPKPQETISKFSLDAIQENVEKVSVRDTVISNEEVNSTPRNYSEISDIRTYDRRGLFPSLEESKSTKKVIRDDGDVRIEVTQCPPKHESTGNAKLKAQKRFKKLIFLRDAPR